MLYMFLREKVAPFIDFLVKPIAFLFKTFAIAKAETVGLGTMTYLLQSE